MNWKLIRLLLLPASWLLLTQCQPCEECGPLAEDPFVNFTIEPTDSLAGAITVQGVITGVRNSLQNQLADSANLSQPEIDSLFVLLDSVVEARDFVVAQVALLRANQTRLDTVWAVGTSLFYINTDTLDVHPLPLNPEADTTTFAIQHFGEYDTLTVRYQREERLADYRLQVFAYNVQNVDTLDHTYDSLYVTFDDADQTAGFTKIIVVK